MKWLHLTVILFVSSIQINGVIRQNCGVRSGGDEVALVVKGLSSKHWPWHAAIYHVVGVRQTYQCGGTLISSNSILTAGHCVSKHNEPILPSEIVVSLGRLNLEVDERSGQSFQVAEIILHPQYDEAIYNNDIAVILLSTNVIFNKYVQPVCLWHSNQLDLYEIIGRLGTVVGWGVTEMNKTSNTLRQAYMPVVRSLHCLATDRKFFGTFLSETNFCAGFRNGLLYVKGVISKVRFSLTAGTRVCNGDSGGSLTFEDNHLHYIRGIVSVGPVKQDKTTGETFCDTMQYALFTDVAQYLPWIEEVTSACEKKVQCQVTSVYRDDYKCEVRLDIKVSERNCKIIFNENFDTDHTNIKHLTIVTKSETIPDLSDAVDKFEHMDFVELDGIGIKSIERRKLIAFKKILVLRFESNLITSLDADTFDDLYDLSALNIGRNQLKEIHRDLFQQLHNLILIFLYGNQLERLPHDLFRNNRQLKEISVRDNILKAIHRDQFMYLQDLTDIYLDKNRIQTLPEGLFRHNQKLERIYLQNNKISKIAADFQHMSTLFVINLKDNICIDEECDVQKFCGTDSISEMQKKIFSYCLERIYYVAFEV